MAFPEEDVRLRKKSPYILGAYVVAEDRSRFIAGVADLAGSAAGERFQERQPSGGIADHDSPWRRSGANALRVPQVLPSKHQTKLFRTFMKETPGREREWLIAHRSQRVHVN